MARRKNDTTDDLPLADVELKPVEVEPEVAPVQEDGVMLSLKQTEFVHGVLYPKDHIFLFSKAEAARRLKTQQFWAIA